MKDLSLSKKGMILVFMTLAFQLFFVALLAYLLNLTGQYVEKERAVREIIFQINRLSSLMDNASIGFADQIQFEDDPRSTSFRQTYGQYVEQIPPQLNLLRKLTARTPYASQVTELCNLVSDGMMTLEACRKACIKNTPERFVLAAELKDTCRRAASQASYLVSKFQRDQDIDIANQKSSRDTVALTLAAATAIDFAIAVFLIVAFTRNIGTRVEKMRNNAVRMATGVPLIPPADTEDELGTLDRALFSAAENLAEAQRKEKAIVENAVDMICSIDEKGTFVNVNRGALNLLGHPPGDLIGRRFIDLVQEESRADTLERFQEAMRSGEPMQFENLLVHRSGREVHADWSMHWSKAESTHFCVVRDVSQRKEVERMKQEFVAMVSHDLKAPLGTVQLALEMLEMGAYGELSEPGTARVKAAAEEIERLIALVNGLLSLEKLESGDYKLELATVKTGDIIKPSLQAVQGQAERAEIEIKAESGADQTELEFKGDRHRLTQVLVNLLANAIKFSPSGSTITISVKVAPAFIRFLVTDEGRGVPGKLKSTIFERYRQADKADETEKGGTGLGLSICKTIVDKHGGAIGVDDNKEKGSIFWFEIPR